MCVDVGMALANPDEMLRCKDHGASLASRLVVSGNSQLVITVRGRPGCSCKTVSALVMPHSSHARHVL